MGSTAWMVEQPGPQDPVVEESSNRAGVVR
jgi:hypothetical protein